MVVTEGIAAVKASLELAKVLSDRLNRPDIDVADVRSKVHEMLIHMVNAQVALGEAQVKLTELRQQIADQEEAKTLEATLEFAEGAYWRRKLDSQLDGPYCLTCWDDKKKLVRLKHTPGRFGEDGTMLRYDCVLHQSMYMIPARIFGPPRIIR